jgi:hypothetical protein
MDLADEQQLTLLLETTLETVSTILNQYLANDWTVPA